MLATSTSPANFERLKSFVSSSSEPLYCLNCPRTVETIMCLTEKPTWVCAVSICQDMVTSASEWGWIGNDSCNLWPILQRRNGAFGNSLLRNVQLRRVSTFTCAQHGRSRRRRLRNAEPRNAHLYAIALATEAAT